MCGQAAASTAPAGGAAVRHPSPAPHSAGPPVRSGADSCARALPCAPAAPRPPAQRAVPGAPARAPTPPARHPDGAACPHPPIGAAGAGYQPPSAARPWRSRGQKDPACWYPEGVCGSCVHLADQGLQRIQQRQFGRHHMHTVRRTVHPAQKEVERPTQLLRRRIGIAQPALQQAVQRQHV